MAYYIDTNCFRVLEGYFPTVFVNFWQRFDEAVATGTIVSIKEVRKELERGNPSPHIDDWVSKNPEFFRDLDSDELQFVATIFQNRHFQGMVGQRQIIAGTPVADPFLVAAAKITEGCVVTEESHKPNSAKIPTVCLHFGIPCMKISDMLSQLSWKF